MQVSLTWPQVLGSKGDLWGDTTLLSAASLGDMCVDLTQVATEQQWESQQVKSVDLHEHKNEHNHRALPW